MSDPDLDIVDTLDDDATQPMLRAMDREGRAARLDRARREITEPEPERTEVPTVPTPEGAEEGPSGVAAVTGDILRGVIEAPRAAATAVHDAVGEITETFLEVTGAAGDFLDERIPLGQVLTQEQVDGLAGAYGNFRPGDPKSVTGRAASEIGQFLVGFVPAMRLTRGLKAGRATVAARSAIAGSLAEVTVIDEQERRLSNLASDLGIAKPITDFLAADPTDSAAEGKFKQAIEGLGVGLMAEGLVQGVKGLVAAKRALGRGKVELPAQPDIPVDKEALGRATPKLERLIKTDERFTAAANSILDAPAGGFVENIPPDIVGNINMAKMGDPAAVRDIIARTARTFKDKVTGPVQTNEQTIRLADEIGIDPNKMAALVLREGDQAFNAAEVTSVRFLLHASGARIRELRTLVGSGQGTRANKFDFLRQLAFHRHLLGTVSGAARESGRALNAFKIQARSDKVAMRMIDEVIDSSRFKGRFNTRDIDVEGLARVMGDMDNIHQINRFAERAGRGRFSDAVLETWINSLLAGPLTHAVNILSNTSIAAWSIPERFLAAGIGRVTGTKGGVSFSEAQAHVAATSRGLQEGFRAMRKSFRSGQPSDRFSKLEVPRQNAVSAGNFGVTEESLIGRGINMLGLITRLPGRFLVAEDEFFKGIGYRMEVHAQAVRQATGEGLQENSNALAARVMEIVNNPTQFSNIDLAAIDAARYQTFQKPLGELGRSVTRAANAHPLIRVIVPFIRTPANIMKFVGERSPLAPLSQAIRADVAAGGARRDLALAKLGLGTGMMFMFAEWGQSGLVTGTGPSDPGLRGTMQRAGWQRNSVKIAGKYFQYSRLDPIGATLGISADLMEIVGMLEDGDATEASAALLVGISQNILSKTYLSGVSDLAEVFGAVSPELGVKRGEIFLQRLAGTLVPFTGLVGQVERVTDPVLRDAQGVVDGIRKRVPGYSDDLPAVVDLWGRPQLTYGGWNEENQPSHTSSAMSIMLSILPTKIGDPGKAAPIDLEMDRLQVSMSKPPRAVDGVPLDPLEYNQYVRLAGNEIKDPATGLGAFDTLNAIVENKHPLSSLYNSQNDAGKALVIKEQIFGFRQMATAVMKQQDRIRAERIKMFLETEQPGPPGAQVPESVVRQVL